MFLLGRLCCGRAAKEYNDERSWVPDGVLDGVRLASCNSWHISASQSAEILRSAMGPLSHVSIFGASPCAGSLVLLGCSGPGGGDVGPAVLPVGQVLPSPWSTAAGATVAPPPARGGGKETGRRTLAWQVGPNATSPPEWCGEAWAGVSSRVRVALAAAAERGPPPPPPLPPRPQVQLLLTPLELGSQLVGALLCAHHSDVAGGGGGGVAPPLAASPPPSESDADLHAHVFAAGGGGSVGGGGRSSRGGGKAARGGGGCKGEAGGGGGFEAQGTGAWRAVAREVAGVLADCLFAPHLRSLQQICAAAHHLSYSPDICTIASVLTTTISEALRQELHLDLQVRMAVAAATAVAVPPPPSLSAAAPPPAALYASGTGGVQYGFLMQLRPRSGTTSQVQLPATTWQIQTADLQHTPTASAPAPIALPPPAVPQRAGGAAAAAATDGRGSCNRPSRLLMLQQQQQQMATNNDMPSRSESFLFVTTADTARLDSGLPGGQDDLPTAAVNRPAGGGGGSAAAAAVAACRLLSESQRDRRIWKAVPFMLSTSLLGDLLLREEPQPTRSLASNIPTGSSVGMQHGNNTHSRYTANFTARFGSPLTVTAATATATTSPRALSACTAAVAGGAGPAADASGVGAGGAAVPPAAVAAGRVRLAATTLQDLHHYLQEVDQPGSDVFLLLGKGRRGSGFAAGATASATPPACLVLLASTARSAGGGSGGGGSTMRQALRRGLSGDLGPLSPTPEDAYGDCDDDGCVGGDASGGGDGARPSLAVFITSHDRLPASLLRAARDAGQRLLEVLLPSALDSLSWGPAALELAEMNVLTDTRAAQGSSMGMMALGRRDSGAFGTASPPVSASCGALRFGLTAARTLSNGSAVTALSAAMPPPVDTTAAAATATAGTAAAVASDPSVGQPALATTAAGRPLAPLQASVAMPPPSVPMRMPLRKFSSRSSMLSRTQIVRTPASTTDGRDGLMPDSPVSSCGGGGGTGGGGAAGGGGGTGGGGARRTHADFVASILSPFTTQSTASTASFTTVKRQASATVNGTLELPTVAASAASASATSAAAAAAAAAAGGIGIGTGSTGGGRGSPSMLPHLLRARFAGMASVGGPQPLPRTPRRSVTDLLDLDGFGGDARAPELPAMDVLLASLYSTLNDADADPSPYASDDLRFLRLSRVLGDGGCSVVYAGRLLGLEVAVKLLEPMAEPEGPPAVGSCNELQQQQVEGTSTGGDSLEAASGGGGGGGRLALVVQQMQQHQTTAQQQAQQQQARWAAARQARLRDLMRGARELAVLTTISHPNIVQVYSYHTNVMVLPGARPDDLPRLLPAGAKQQQQSQPPQLLLQHQQQQQQQPSSGPLRVAIVMECCDMGSLADALDSGRFKDAIIRAATAARSSAGPVGVRRANSNLDRARVALATAAAAWPQQQQQFGGGRDRAGSITAQGIGGGVAMSAIYLTLLEVALALRHLHAKSLAHCDVKAANVLLKSSASDPRGFTCKLGDFGLVSIVRKEAAGPVEGVAPVSNQDGAVGTITHLAPEYFSPGTRLDFSVDMYAFGIVMWEVFTSKPPYIDHAARAFKDLPHLVVNEGHRPRWPPHTPTAYRNLACACWSTDPTERPTAAAVVAALQRLMES